MKVITICDDPSNKVSVGKVALKNGHPTVDDIVSYFSSAAKVEKIPLKSDCTLLAVTK